ncbi:MAG: TRAP transporter small permease [Oscillospiraceae bacterium]|nr:TRAP transporter small permease [Oscillospiraceae bacterium]MBO7422939.1 TRAP transporter small permease [Oscillospiraceae bacterium]MBP5169793.1 TRAP transporter small permease [Oscillospiraceae bacterium]
MNLYRKILNIIAKIATVISMIAVLVMVSFIVMELIRRNIFNRSFRPTIEICGISFLWMAFMGIIPLYNQSGLMRLDFLISRVKGPAYEGMVLLNKLVSLMLGVIMVVAFCAQYPFVSTRFYSTFSTKVPYSVQYFPMAIAGAFMALKALEELIEWLVRNFGKKGKEEQV